MKQNDNLKLTFWELLGNYIVEIPQIQRDYAQGRDSAVDLRNRFLDHLLQALEQKKELRLDFIYGDTFYLDGMKAFHPLDGQQRLTTLWLLHWYVAFKAGSLKTEKRTFRKFRYMVRASSDAFLGFLCEFDRKCEIGKLCETIREQNGFYTAWHQDPTVVSILNMLDSMEEKFKPVTDFMPYWNSLTADPSTCPIYFYLLPLKDIGHTDDLYIKMNARGKALSGFENFKADLIKVIRKEGWGEKLEYSKLLDGAWTDVFWSRRWKETGQFDEIYLAFITRYLSHVFLCEGKSSGGKNHTEDSIKNENPVEWKLYLESAVERGESKYRYEYTSFEPYRSLVSGTELKRLEILFENFAKIQSLPLPPWESESPLEFIPKYSDSDHISMLTMRQRLMFHGICCYLRLEGFDEIKFGQWMRIVWNLSENLNTESSLSGLMGALRTIDELGEHSHDIYEWLIKDESLTNVYGRAQVFEEREKARKILSGGTEWEEKIVDAEKEYKGAIRFLFLDGGSKVNWYFFDPKKKRLSEILTNKGIKEEYRKDAVLLKTFLSYCVDWRDQLESWSGHYRYIYGYEYDLWRNSILLRVVDSQKGPVELLYASPVHHVLMGDGKNPNPCLLAGNVPDVDEYHLLAYDALVNTDILTEFSGPYYYVRWFRSNLCLYPSSEGVMLTMKERDKILTDLVQHATITLDGKKIHGMNNSSRKIIDGWEVAFTYKNYSFIWYVESGESQIRMKTDGGYDRKNVTGTGFTWQKGDFDENAFLGKLDNAIAQLQSLLAKQSATPAETTSSDSQP